MGTADCIERLRGDSRKRRSPQVRPHLRTGASQLSQSSIPQTLSLHKMAQTARETVFLFIAWLVFATTGLADERPSASIHFTPGSRTKRRHHRNSQYSAAEVIYGPLVPRIHGTQVQSEVLGRAEPGEPGLDTYGSLIHVPGCFYCPPQDLLLLTGRQLLQSLTTEKMQTYMRINGKTDLLTSVSFVPRPSLSLPNISAKKASTWTCSKNKLSIWVSNGLPY
jgi:hypothetical protein